MVIFGSDQRKKTEIDMSNEDKDLTHLQWKSTFLPLLCNIQSKALVMGFLIEEILVNPLNNAFLPCYYPYIYTILSIRSGQYEILKK